jgi:hypothetical protein
MLNLNELTMGSFLDQVSGLGVYHDKERETSSYLTIALDSRTMLFSKLKTADFIDLKDKVCDTRSTFLKSKTSYLVTYPINSDPVIKEVDIHTLEERLPPNGIFDGEMEDLSKKEDIKKIPVTKNNSWLKSLI